MSASIRGDGLVIVHVVVEGLEQLVRVTRVHTVRLQIARHVGAGQSQLARCGGQVGGAARGHEVEPQGVLGPRRTAVVRGEPQRNLSGDQDLQDLGQGQPAGLDEVGSVPRGRGHRRCTAFA